MALNLLRKNPINPTKKYLVVSTFLLTFAPRNASGSKTYCQNYKL